MTGRSTTRVAQAPGGTSQITFGGGNFGAEQASFNNPVAARVSANSYANGANQNCGNVMTGRSTTRVAQAPGGTSQISFGGGDDVGRRGGGGGGTGATAIVGAPAHRGHNASFNNP